LEKKKPKGSGKPLLRVKRKVKKLPQGERDLTNPKKNKSKSEKQSNLRVLIRQKIL